MVLDESVLDAFKSTILRLDFYKDVTDDRGKKKEMVTVPDNFTDEQQYLDVFLPLYWEELRANLNRAKYIEMGRTEEITHISIDPNVFVKLKYGRMSEDAANRFYSQNDLVLLTQNVDPLADEPVHFLGIVDVSIKMEIEITTKFSSNPPEGSRDERVAKIIAKKGNWNLAKVVSLNTMLREYEGLMSLPRIPLRSLIVNREDVETKRDASTEMQAAPAAPKAFEDTVKKHGVATADMPVLESNTFFDIPDKLQGKIREGYNESQEHAISGSRRVTGITLVQGPPGTGKTTTLLGILAALFSSRAIESNAVSYTRTTGKRASAKDASLGSDTSSDESEDDEAREKRELERARMMRCRAPWMLGNYAAWADTVEQHVPVSGSDDWRNPYPKLHPREIRSMSEVQKEVTPQKVLVCAPSNAGIDEVLRRIVRDGILSADGVRERLSVIRLGPNLHSSLDEYSFETMVKRRLKAAGGDLHNRSKKEEVKARLLMEARIVCTTLSISGHQDITGFPEDFDTVIIDEASQGVEISTLVPLKLGCKRLILIGDPKQLPATCFSEVAKAHNYERSLFERLQETQHKVYMLQTQYRMHPHISSFPSKTFYEGNLINALDRPEFESKFPNVWSKISCFGPMMFFDVKGEHRKYKTSLVNDAEADFIIHFFKVLSELYPEEPWREKLAVISPYAEQVQLIRSRFRALFPKEEGCPVDVGTVDGFQGREKDCIIVSVVRANPDPDKESIGFVRDRRRMNVAFTRARQNLWVVGYSEVLRKNYDWGAFIKQAEAGSQLIRVGRPFDGFFGPYLDNWFSRHPEVPKPDTSRLPRGAGAQEVEDLLSDSAAALPAADPELFRRVEAQDRFQPDLQEDLDDGAPAVEGGRKRALHELDDDEEDGNQDGVGEKRGRLEEPAGRGESRGTGGDHGPGGDDGVGGDEP
mmetsp:Transcript_58457/g.165104  ORF Transcript_58457/g.165104 Transcript_58457/m.165104 type:complete len:930 (+) Transcript_58457:59-2848(+)